MVRLVFERISPVLSWSSIDDFPVKPRPKDIILGSGSWNKPANGFPNVVPIFSNDQTLQEVDFCLDLKNHKLETKLRFIIEKQALMLRAREREPISY